MAGAGRRNWTRRPSVLFDTLSREAVLEHPPRCSNLRLVLGGKITTARLLMAQLATELTGRPCAESATVPLPRAEGQPTHVQP
jgi:glycerol-3-phosphate dehydrogenase